MIFIDSNIPMYLVGTDEGRRADAIRALGAVATDPLGHGGPADVERGGDEGDRLPVPQHAADGFPSPPDRQASILVSVHWGLWR